MLHLNILYEIGQNGAILPRFSCVYRTLVFWNAKHQGRIRTSRLQCERIDGNPVPESKGSVRHLRERVPWWPFKDKMVYDGLRQSKWTTYNPVQCLEIEKLYFSAEKIIPSRICPMILDLIQPWSKSDFLSQRNGTSQADFIDHLCTGQILRETATFCSNFCSTKGVRKRRLYIMIFHSFSTAQNATVHAVWRKLVHGPSSTRVLP